jgi:hypothetical protein
MMQALGVHVNDSRLTFYSNGKTLKGFNFEDAVSGSEFLKAYSVCRKLI